MKIHREVNGVLMEFELTSQEMMDAYYAKEHEWDMNYVLDLAEWAADYDRPDTVERLDALRSDPELLSRTAYRYRKYMDDYITGDAESENFRDAYRYVTENFRAQPPV